jgi:hypothetical protein
MNHISSAILFAAIVGALGAPLAEGAASDEAAPAASKSLATNGQQRARAQSAVSAVAVSVTSAPSEVRAASAVSTPSTASTAPAASRESSAARAAATTDDAAGHAKTTVRGHSEVRERSDAVDPLTASVLGDAELANQRGGSDSHLNQNNSTGAVTGNVASQLNTGSNTISESAFSNSSGIPIVIQNSGNNVLIQNSTILNLQLTPSK